MILKRYCIDCGKIEPPEGTKCCPDCRVFWVEKDAAERLNADSASRGKHFDSLLSQLGRSRSALTELREALLAGGVSGDDLLGIVARGLNP